MLQSGFCLSTPVYALLYDLEPVLVILRPRDPKVLSGRRFSSSNWDEDRFMSTLSSQIRSFYGSIFSQPFHASEPPAHIFFSPSSFLCRPVLCRRLQNLLHNLLHNNTMALVGYSYSLLETKILINLIVSNILYS